MQNLKVKRMVQGAIIAGIFGTLALLNTYTGGLFDIFICYVMVIPLTWYGYNYSLKENVLVAFVSMVINFMVGTPFFIASSIATCLSGLFLGEALKRKAGKGVILLGTFLVSLLNNFFIYEVFASLLQMNIRQEVAETYQTLVQTMPVLENYVSLDVMLSFVPLVIVIMSVLEMYVIVLLCQITLTRFKVEFPGQFHIAAMHIKPRTGIVIAIVMGVSYIVPKVTELSSIYWDYAFILSNLIFVLQGLSFLSFYLIVVKKPKWMILVFIGLFVPFIQPIYSVLGIVDIFSDLRRKIVYNNKENL